MFAGAHGIASQDAAPMAFENDETRAQDTLVAKKYPRELTCVHARHRTSEPIPLCLSVTAGMEKPPKPPSRRELGSRG
jgi:hypothetical protein